MATMDPRALISRDLLAPRTPMGRPPFNRWVEYGPGGDPYEPRGLFPNYGGENRLAPGYDGLGEENPSLIWQRAESQAIRVPPQKLVRATQNQASAEVPRRPARKRGRLVAPLVPLNEATEESSDKTMFYLIFGGALGIGLAYVLYDETLGTGAMLRRRSR